MCVFSCEFLCHPFLALYFSRKKVVAISCFFASLTEKSGNNIGVTCVTFGGSIWNLGVHSPSTVYQK